MTALPAPRWSVVLGGGAAAGLIGGLFGVGGGVLLVPLLVLVLHVPQHRAHATSLVAVACSAVTGAVRFGMDGAVAVPGAIALSLGAITGAQIGARFMKRMTEGNLRRAFAIVLLLLALRFFFTGGDPSTAAGADTAVPAFTLPVLALHVLGGVAAGIISSVLGVGGGVITVPLLVLAFGYGQHIAEGTSLAVIIPTAVTGALAHHRSGLTDWRLGGWLGLGAVAGAGFGASIALGLPADTLARFFGVLQLVVAGLMLRGSRPRLGGDRARS